MKNKDEKISPSSLCSMNIYDRHRQNTELKYNTRVQNVLLVVEVET